MVHFIYRLNIFGSKAARDKMMNSHRGFGGPGFGPGPGRHGRIDQKKEFMGCPFQRCGKADPENNENSRYPFRYSSRCV